MSLMTTGLVPPELSESGTEMMTPFPVPIHSRCKLIIIEVIRTKEKPNFPVPTKSRNLINKLKRFHTGRSAIPSILET